MDAKAFIDEIRTSFVADKSISPSREVVYTRNTDLVSTTLQAYVGVGLFNKTERELIGRYESFGGLALTVPPKVNDVVEHDGVSWKVARWTKMGLLYTVYGENKLHAGKPIR